MNDLGHTLSFVIMGFLILLGAASCDRSSLRDELSKQHQFVVTFLLESHASKYSINLMGESAMTLDLNTTDRKILNLLMRKGKRYKSFKDYDKAEKKFVERGTTA